MKGVYMNKRLSISSCISCPYLQRQTKELIKEEDKTAYWTVEYYCGYSILKNDKELKIPIDVISDKKILNLCPLQDEAIL
jgi:hypothetical protein